MNVLRVLFNSTGKIALVLAICCTASLTAEAIGVLDLSFGDNGKVITDFGRDSQIKAVAIQPDNKIVAVGIVTADNGDKDVAIARYNSNGTLDATFNRGGFVVSALTDGDDIVEAVALQPDGKIVVAGRIAVAGQNQVYDFLVARYDANGVLDAGFGNNGLAIVNLNQSDYLYAVAVCANGKIVAAGDSGAFQPVVIEFNADGSLDTDFADQGLFSPAIPDLPILTFRALGLQPNGNIIVGGTALPDSVRKILIIALTPNGVLAQGFGNNGIATSYGGQKDISVTDLTVKPNGEILTVGQISAHFLANGTYKGRFNGGRNGDIAVAPNGKIVTTSSNYTSVAPAEFVYLSTDGGQFVGRADLGITYVTDVAVQSDNKIVSAGMVHANPNQSGQRNFVLIRYLAVTSRGTRLFNSFVDAQTNIGVYRPSNQTFYILSGYNGEISSQTALTPVMGIVPETFRSNCDIPTYWSAPDANAGGFFHGQFDFDSGTDEFQWGANGDLPVGGDYDGDGITDFTVFRPASGTWYTLRSSDNQFRSVQFGQQGDKLVPADYDYDGITDIAVFRPANGTWYILHSSDNNFSAVQFGASGDFPVTGDYDGDGSADYVVYRPSNGTWYLLNTTEGFRTTQFGIATDQPVPGDYDGDGRHDIAVFREGVWYILQSRAGFKAVQWGAPEDVPISVRY